MPLASVPKSGNTWLRIVLDIVLRQGKEFRLSKLDMGIQPAERAVFDEWLGVPSSDLTEGELADIRAPAVAEGWRQFSGRRAASLRFYKIHDAYLPPPGGEHPPLPKDDVDRAIYIVRDPRDVALSLASFRGVSIDEAIEFLSDPGAKLAGHPDRLAPSMPQFISDWSSHAASWLDQRDFPVHLVRYEDMLATPSRTFSTLLRFLGLDIAPAALADAVELSRFEHLQAAERHTPFAERPPLAMQFFRRGSSGQWRKALDPRQCGRLAEAHGVMMRRLGYL